MDYEIKYLQKNSIPEGNSRSLYLTEISLQQQESHQQRIQSLAIAGTNKLSPEEINRQAELKYREWKSFVKNNSRQLHHAVDKYEISVLTPKQPKPLKKKVFARPKTAETFFRAKNGLDRDISQQKMYCKNLASPSRPRFSSILLESTWDERFVFEKPLSPPKRRPTSSYASLQQHSSLSSPIDLPTQSSPPR